MSDPTAIDRLMSAGTFQERRAALTNRATFPQFCRLVDEHLEGHFVRERFDRAILIEFEDGQYDHMLETIRNEDREALLYPPTLPADDVLLWDAGSLVLLTDVCTYEYGERVQDLSAFDQDAGEANVLMSGLALVTQIHDFKGDPVGFMCLTDFVVTAVREGGAKRGVGANPHWVIPIGPGMPDLPIPYEEYGKAFPKLIGPLNQDLIAGIATSFDELQYVDLPRHHIVIESPRKARTPGGKKVRRNQDRERIRLIRPEDIHRIYARPISAQDGTQPTHRSVAPHLRMGYTKYLTAERWKQKRWQRVRVRPTWIGEREWERGSYRYKVLTGRKEDNHE